MKYDRFEHENQIMKCWQIIDQIDTIAQSVGDHDWTQDQTMNALIGIKEIYQLEFDKLFNHFEKSLEQFL